LTLVAARQPREGPQLAFRWWRPPVSARVEVADGLPCHVESRRVRGRVDRAAGPWRGSGDWWSRQSWEREEWDVGLEGALYRLVRIVPAREWVLEGAYD
jgi:protein ImuB